MSNARGHKRGPHREIKKVEDTITPHDVHYRFQRPTSLEHEFIITETQFEHSNLLSSSKNIPSNFAIVSITDRIGV
jgi:hypothetical protein